MDDATATIAINNALIEIGPVHKHHCINPMTPLSAHDDRRWVIIDRWLAFVFVALLAYSVLVWQGVLGDGHSWRPFQTVLLCSGLALQGIAPLVRRKSRVLFYALLSASLVALGFSLTAR